MSEKPTWLKGVREEGGDEMGEEMRANLAAVEQVILDSAPENWKEEIDDSLLGEYRNEVMKMSNKELLAFCRNNYVWDDPTYAKALLDVIRGKTTPPLREG
jgi:hypothetical protein